MTTILAFLILVFTTYFGPTPYEENGRSTGNLGYVIFPDSISYPFSAGDEIAAITPRGTVSGAAVWNGPPTYLTLWGDDDMTPGAIEGHSEGEPLFIRHYDPNTGKESGVLLSLNTSAGPYYGSELVYTEDGILVADAAALATNTVSLQVNSIAGKKGATVDVPIILTFNETQNLGGFQLDATSSGNVSVAALSRGAAVLSGTWSVASNFIQGGQRFLAFTTGPGLAAGTHEIIVLSINIESGNGGTVTLSNLVGSLATPRGEDANLTLGTSTVTVTADPRGDVNGDGKVNLSDLTLSVDIVLGSRAYNANADVYPFDGPKDGRVDVRDITILAYAIAANEWPDGGWLKELSDDQETVNLMKAQDNPPLIFRGRNGIYDLYTNFDVRAVLVELSGEDSLTVPPDVSLVSVPDSNKTTYLVYRLSTEPLPQPFATVYGENVQMLAAEASDADDNTVILSYELQNTTSSESTELPSEFIVSKNYPDPFNPVTNVRISLPAAGRVSTALYNVLGQRIREETVNMNAGVTTVAVDLSGQASGLYFFAVSYNGKTFTETLTFTK